jgi:hypothetical protein
MNETISQSYKEMQIQLHQDPNYGVMSIEMAPMVLSLAQNNGVKSISDYGAGKCNLRKRLKEISKLKFDYRPYDPAFPEYGKPRAADLVCCLDVLEHIEADFIDNVISDLGRITRKLGLFTVHTGPAMKVLPDGRNAHLTQEPSSWWLSRLCPYFNIKELQSSETGFLIIVEPINKR